jgi:hypothetical protein
LRLCLHPYQVELSYQLMQERIEDGYSKFSASLRSCDARVPQNWLSQYARPAHYTTVSSTSSSTVASGGGAGPDADADADASGSGSGAAEAGAHVTCVVCFSAVEQGEVMIELPCGHSFHDPCVRPWFHNKTSCPMCRAEIPKTKA